MTDVRDLRLSFAGGELSPRMAPRADLRAHQIGLAECQNWIPWPQGELRSRPGTEKILSAAVDRIFTFDHSAGQSYLLAVQGHRCRIYFEGLPVVYGTLTQPAVSIDYTTDSITFAEPHRFLGDELVAVTADYGSALPGGVVVGTFYYVAVSDARTVRLSTAPGGAAIVNLTAASVSGVRLASSLPRAYVQPVVVTFGASDTISASNDLRDGDVIVFTGTVPALLAAGTQYVVTDRTTTTWKLADVYGNAVTFAATVTVGTTASKVYYPGDVAYLTVTTSTFTRCALACVGQTAAGTNPVVAAVDGASATVSVALSEGFMRLPDSGELEVALPFAQADLPGVTLSQSADVATLTAYGYESIELRRWSLSSFSTVTTRSAVGGVPSPALGLVAPSVTLSPTLGVVVANVQILPPVAVTRGVKTRVTSVNQVFSTRQRVDTGAAHLLGKGDPVIVENSSNTFYIPNGKYLVAYSEEDFFVLKTLDGFYLTNPGSLVAMTADVYYTSLSDPDSHEYAITAVDAAGRESAPARVTASNTLGVVGSYNTLRWMPVAEAVQYRVYRRLDGVFGLILTVAASDALTTSGVDYFQVRDDYITPNLSQTLGELDSFGWNARTSCYFDQRRVFAGTDAAPQRVWLTRPNRSYDMLFHVPQLDDDRVQFDIASNDAHTIRHVVSGQDLYVFTTGGEFIAASDGPATPTSFTVRQATAHGANPCRPLLVSDGVLFVERRGGHVRLLSYDWRSQRHVAPDVSILASHLFDGFTVPAMALQRAPVPIVWCASSSGLLLGATYAPEEDVRGWHKHDLGGTVLDCTVTRESSEDRLYVLVSRGGVRTVERLLPLYTEGRALDGQVTAIEDPPGAITVTPIGPRRYRLSASAPVFSVSDTRERIRVGLATYRIELVTNGNTAEATLETTPPAGWSLSATEDWAILRRTVTGMGHLEGLTVTVQVDGADYSTTVVGGVATAPVAGETRRAGLPFTSSAQTLPMAAQIDGLGYGREKNVGHVWLRGTGAVSVGPTPEFLVPAALSTTEARVPVPPLHQPDASIRIVRTGTASATVTSAVLGVAIGD